jgi:hypothetical protein
MPTRPSSNVVGKFIEFPPELVAELQAFAAARGQTFRAVVIDACRRHLRYPPPVPVVPDPADEPHPDSVANPSGATDRIRSPQPRRKR